MNLTYERSEKMSNKEKEVIIYGVYLPEVIFGPIGTVEISNYSIMFKENNITITPYSKITNSPRDDKKFTIDGNNVKKISISDGNFGFFKIIIHGYDEDLFGFQISKHITEKQKNIIYFISEHYDVENLDLIIEKKMSKPVPIISAVILLIFMIIGCIGSILSYGIIGIGFTIIVIISMVKWFKDIKQNKNKKW